MSLSVEDQPLVDRKGLCVTNPYLTKRLVGRIEQVVVAAGHDDRRDPTRSSTSLTSSVGRTASINFSRPDSSVSSSWRRGWGDDAGTDGAGMAEGSARSLSLKHRHSAWTERTQWCYL